MQVLVKSHDPKAESLRSWAHERVAFVFRRHATATSRATIRLADLNGPRGGLDKQCVIELNCAGTSGIVASAVAKNWHAALNRALARALASLNKAAQRARVLPAVRITTASPEERA